MTARVLRLGLAALAASAAFATTAARAAPSVDGAAEKLRLAVQDGDNGRLKTLLAHHVDPNARLPDTSTALFWAVDRQDPETVRLLLAAGAKPNIGNQDGVTPFLLACERGGAPIVRQLLEAHAGVAVSGADGVSALALCAVRMPPELLDQIIQKGAPLESAGGAGQTPLMFAAANANTDNIAVLVRHGAKLDAISKKGFTALMFAVRAQSEPTVRALLAAGADVSEASPEGLTALQLALYGKDGALAPLLIQHGAFLNGWDENGRQPLHVALLQNNPDLMKMMLAKGADPNGPTRMAYRIDPDDAVQKLKARKAKTPAQQPVFYDFKALGYTPRTMFVSDPAFPAVPTPPPAVTPLLMAAGQGSDEMMKMLVAAGARSDFKSDDGMDVVLEAVGSGKLAAVQYAVSVHPDLSGVTKGAGVMHTAILKAKGDEGLAIVHYLAQHGASLDAKNAAGQTPGDLAATLGSPQLKALWVQILAERAGPTPAKVRALAN